ncbi:hypothetical protein E2C01_034781 [Portunus trituberculatus]|uniref:Uncharacterized protein n=1 Tax=Portunus trituberculatus TaxID=210409 RepID=A0A5B7F9N4_PORTR|nr:hypothetical protein [Portunus trituberculatus]
MMVVGMGGEGSPERAVKGQQCGCSITQMCVSGRNNKYNTLCLHPLTSLWDLKECGFGCGVGGLYRVSRCLSQVTSSQGGGGIVDKVVSVGSGRRPLEGSNPTTYSQVLGGYTQDELG